MNIAPPLPRDPRGAARSVAVDLHAVAGAERDPQAAWRALGRAAGEEHGLIWSTLQDGHWIATNAEMVEQIYRDNERFSNIVLNVPAERFDLKLLPIQLDGAQHRKVRALIEPAFRPAMVQAFSIPARRLAVELVEGLQPKGGCEFVSDFALILPLSVFLWIVDLPLEDRPMLQRWVHTCTRGTMEQAQQAFGNLVEYVDTSIRKRAADLGDDLLSTVITAKVDGRPLTHEEQLGTGMLLMLAGLDTVAAMMSFVMKYLAGHSEARRWIIANPTQISVATEELMRRHGVANNTRTATCDVQLGGVTIHKGEHVLLPNCVHGMDEALFPSPETVDFNRELTRTATFGFGPHRCAGANLARMEMRIMLQEWLARIPEFELDPSRPVRQQTAAVNGILDLPLRWGA